LHLGDACDGYLCSEVLPVQAIPVPAKGDAYHRAAYRRNHAVVGHRVAHRLIEVPATTAFGRLDGCESPRRDPLPGVITESYVSFPKFSVHVDRG